MYLVSIEAFLQDLQDRFGGTLLAVFRLGLFDVLAEEVASLKLELETRGVPGELAIDILNAWIVVVREGE